MSESVQTYKNHAKFDPPFHFFLAPLLLVNLIAMVRQAIKHSDAGSWWVVVLSLVALVAVFKMRIYSLKVQDRVIRLEERIRLSTLLPEALRSRIGALSERQLIALRFASDAEVPALVQQTLDQNLPPAEIKKRITQWRADHFRV